ncbi:cubilin-like [Oculina patagonica]
MASSWIVTIVMVFFLAVVASDPCVPPGEFINGSSGFFTSPNFPNNFPANSNCTWNITVPTGRIIKVTFLNFTLEPNQNSGCIGEAELARVFITNVASDDGAQDFKICGQDLPAPVYSVGNSILVRLRSLSNVYSGFNASYEAIDGGQLCPRGITLTEASGVITSPYFPRLYPDNQNCSWQITAPQGNRVKLEIANTLNIQQCGPLPDCTCDYLQVQNGFSADHNGDDRICSVPGEAKTYYSTHESLKVLFVSDDTGSKQYDGFEATYTQLNYSPPSCPTEAISLSGNGTLSSPNYPMSNYPASRNCSWIITVPSGKQVKFTFTELALGSCENACSSDNCTYVELYDGASTSSSLLGRFCNGSVLHDVLSSGNQMFVNFRSGSSLDRGFEAQYSVTYHTACLPPGDFLWGSSGFFTSPNFPNNFPENSNCTWNITVPTGRIIKVTFLNFTLEPNQNPACIGEAELARVFITNVASDNGAQDFKICGQDLPAPVYSVGNSILVRLRSLSNVYSGFNASYEAIDGGQLCPRGITLTEASGVITSPYFPRLYPDNQNCSWQITAPQGNRVKLEIANTLNIQQCGPLPDCTCDYLQVQNGFSADHNGDDRICSVPGEAKTYYSTHESLKVLFVSDVTGSKQYDGFQATYTQLNYSPPICPTEAIPLSGNGTLSSPNYPMSNYPASRNCSWIITVPAGKQVKFAFTELALGSCENACSSNNCTYVELYDGASTSSSSLGRFCNGSVLQDVLSSGSQLFVNFRSGSSLDRGFEAHYSVFSARPTTTPSSTMITPSQTVTTPRSTVTVPTTAPSDGVDNSKIDSNKVLLILANKEFLRNGNRTSYIQIIVIQLKDEDQDVGTSTDEKYAAKNINKDYETKEEGEAYITAVFDYGKTEFTIGDEKHYSRSKEGSKIYLNGELESNTNYAVFQRSFDDYGSYDTEKFIFFKTKKSFPLVTVIVIVLVVVLVAAVLIAFAVYLLAKKRKRAVASGGTDMVVVNKNHAPYLDQDPEYQLTADEKLAPGSVICNPTYDDIVESGQREGGDYEEIKEGSTAKEGHYQQLDSKHTPDYEGLKPPQGLDTSL